MTKNTNPDNAALIELLNEAVMDTYAAEKANLHNVMCDNIMYARDKIKSVIEALTPPMQADCSTPTCSEQQIERVKKLWHEKSFGWMQKDGAMLFGGWGEDGAFSIISSQFTGKAREIFNRVISELCEITDAIQAINQDSQGGFGA